VGDRMLKGLMDESLVFPHRVTQLLQQWSHGDDSALAELTPLVYEELRRLAHRCSRVREILVFDSTGKLERSIAFSKADLKL
jgi:ECF sigma factor